MSSPRHCKVRDRKVVKECKELEDRDEKLKEDLTCARDIPTNGHEWIDTSLTHGTSFTFALLNHSGDTFY